MLTALQPSTKPSRVILPRDGDATISLKTRAPTSSTSIPSFVSKSPVPWMPISLGSDLESSR